MADVYGVYYDQFVNNAVKAATKQQPGGERGAFVRFFYDYYECSSLAAGSVIKLGPIPKGARILPSSFIMCDALGTGVTCKVGDEDDDDRFVAASTSIATAVVVQFNDVSTLMDNVPYKALNTEGDALIITIAGASANGSIAAFIFYTMP